MRTLWDVVSIEFENPSDVIRNLADRSLCISQTSACSMDEMMTDTNETGDLPEVDESQVSQRNEEDHPSKHNVDDHRTKNVKDCCDCQGTW